MKKNALHWQILIGIIIGLLLGVFIPATVPTLSVLGDIFIRALKMIVVPLIVSSLITGVTNINTGKTLGRIGGKTLVYYLSTSLLALITGLIFVNIFKPGTGVTIDLPAVTNLQIEEKAFSETLINIVPENIFVAMTNTDMLALIFFSILFGIFITKMELNLPLFSSSF